MPDTSIRIFDNPDLMAAGAAEAFAQIAQQAIRDRGRFVVALAGGGTPRQLYERLSGPPHRAEIDWPRLEIFWSDERTVPPDDAQSNYRLAYESLLNKVPIEPAGVHRLRGELEDAAQAAALYQQEIATVLGVSAGGPPPPFDLILLGIGEDGHTASLFPHTAALAEVVRWVTANDVPQHQLHRLTMTYPIINRARQVMFLAAGTAKAEVLAEILEGPLDPERLPAQAVQPTDGELSWFLDRPAAAGLNAATDPSSQNNPY